MTTFAEFARETPEFKLCGGPFDGRTVPTSNYSAWPREIKMVRTDDGSADSLDSVERGRVCVYRMRIGDLDHYDFAGTEQ